MTESDRIERAVVTGGGGFIGSHVAEHLLAQGARVLVIDDFSSGDRANVPVDADLAELDIRDAAAIGKAFDEFRPQLVAHLAAQSSVTVSVSDPEHDLRVNVEGTFNVCDQASRVGATVVFASTGGALYGDRAPVPTPEDAIPEPLAPYGASKLGSEGYVGTWGRLFDLPNVVLRLGNVYGPRQSSTGEAGVVAIFSDALLSGRSPTVFGDGLQTRDYIHVADVARAFIAAGSARLPGTFNVGWGRETTVIELLDLLAASAGVDVEPTFVPLRAGEMKRSALDAGRLAAQTSWTPQVSLSDGLRETFAWYRSVHTVS